MADGRRRAFIGSFTAAGGPGIVTAAVDPGSGALTVLSTVDAVPDPSYLALSPDGRGDDAGAARRRERSDERPPPAVRHDCPLSSDAGRGDGSSRSLKV